MEYLIILHHYFSKLYPKLVIQENENHQRFVLNLSQPQLYSIIGDFLNFLKNALKRFDLLSGDSGYRGIIEKAKKQEYYSLQQFTNDVQKIFIHLKKSSIREISDAAYEMSDEYATHLDPIFQHLGFCCSEKVDENIFCCGICKRWLHDFCENYFPLVDGNEFICRHCKFLNGINENSKKGISFKGGLEGDTMQWLVKIRLSFLNILLIFFSS